MAILLPSPHLKHVKMTPGERSFAARILAKLEDDYRVWFDVPIGRRQLRPDFVVLHPGRGLLVLEVKDWHLDTIRQIDAKTVELLTDQGIKHVANPLEQARQYALEITTVLERDGLLVEPAESQYRGRLILPWGYGVVLTHITRQQFERSGMDQAIPGHKVVCRDEMAERIDAEAFQERLWGMFNHRFGKNLSLAQIDRIRWHLFPEIRIDQRGLFPVPGLEPESTQTDASAPADPLIPELMAVMDREQERFARNMGSGHRMIHGVAGSGKTLILAQRCILLSREPVEKPVLVLCYNKTLAGKLRHMLRLQGAGDHVHIWHFHGWCKEMCSLYQLDLPGGSASPVWERQVAAVIEGVDRGRVPRAQYSAILIDEGHDFEPEWFSLVVRMLDPETNALLLVYDDAQAIYKRKRPKTWASVGIQVPGRRSTIFRVNYRNTAEALDVAFRFVAQYLGEQGPEDDIPQVRPDPGLRHGAIPVIRRCATLEEELTHIAGWVKSLSSQGIPRNRIAILCRFNQQVLAVGKAFRRLGIRSLSTDADRAMAADVHSGDAVRVLTMHASKGLEFHSVAIPDLGSMPFAKEPEAEEGRLLYVALTRSTHEVLLTHHSESVFTRRLSQQMEEIGAPDRDGVCTV